MTKLITNKNYRDNHGNDWNVIASKDNPIILSYMNLIIKTIALCTELMKRPIAYHFWIRLNKGINIIKFTDMLNKHFKRRNNFKIKYIRVKEYDEQYSHHHFMLFVDKAIVHPQSIVYFLKSHTRK